MKKSTAYLLVVHGSRSVNYAQQLRQLAKQMRSYLSSQNRSIQFTTAYLELAEKPLHQEIIDLTTEYALQGYKCLKVLPLFLLSGTHVLQDIPEQVALARVNSPLSIELMTSLGKSPYLLNFLRSQFLPFNNSEKILLAHGTRFKKGNEELIKIAEKLEAKVAYWSIEPKITHVIKQIHTISSESSITILPYFLFTGRITDTIVSTVNDLPQIITGKVNMLPTLAQNEEFSHLIAQYMWNSEKVDELTAIG